MRRCAKGNCWIVSTSPGLKARARPGTASLMTRVVAEPVLQDGTTSPLQRENY